jgi:hypothetical protein
MKNKFFLLLPVFIISMGVTAQDEDVSACAKKYFSAWGNACPQCGAYAPKTYTVRLKNVCKETIDIKCAVQESNKKWRCFTHNAVAPNDTVQAYACAGTGKYLKWVRKTNDKQTMFPTDDEVNKEYAE